MTRILLVASVTAMWSVPRAGLAQDAPRPATPPSGAAVAAPDAPTPTKLAVDRPAAETLFDLGQKLIDEGRAADACPRLAESMRLDPAPGTLMNLARCHELIGKTASAWAEYRQAAIMAQKVGDVERAEAAAGYARALEPVLSKLTVVATRVVPDLEILRNGVRYGEASLGVPLVVDPGPQRIEVRAPGFSAYSTVVEVADGGGAATVTVPALAPLPAEAAAAPRNSTEPASAGSSGSLRIAGLTTAIIGAVTVGAGAVLGAIAATEVSDAEGDDALCGADRRCTPEGLAQIDAADGKATAATALFAIGGGAVLGGLVLVLAGELGGDSSEPEVVATRTGLVPTVGADGGGLTWRGSF